eukprot:10920933-Lingulodinium_polyedra.AAC.1
MDTEVAHRVSAMQAVCAPLRGPVFGARCIRSTVQVQLARSLLWTRLLCLAETWVDLPPGARRRINGAYLSVARRCAGV